MLWGVGDSEPGQGDKNEKGARIVGARWRAQADPAQHQSPGRLMGGGQSGDSQMAPEDHQVPLVRGSGGQLDSVFGQGLCCGRVCWFWLGWSSFFHSG